MQCWAVFAILRLLSWKQQLKQNLSINFLKTFLSTVIDLCTIKYLNFVSIENFYSCLIWAKKWVNIKAMSYIWLSFGSGTSYCLEFSTTSNSHAACENFVTTLGCSLKSFRCWCCTMPENSKSMLNTEIPE